MDNWYLYIVDKKGKLYVGVTTDLPNRMRQHAVMEPLYAEGLVERPKSRGAPNAAMTVPCDALR